MEKDFLLEIGVEELPAALVDEGIYKLTRLFKERLNQNRINFDKIKTYGTPRRLTTMVSNLSDTQKSQERTITGPPEKIAFNDDGSPTKAAVGFAKSLKKKVEDLEKINTERGVYIGIKIVEEGKSTKEILPNILKDIIQSLSFSKQMGWANYSMRFARPIRWIAALLGKEIIKFDIEGLHSSNNTFGHRTLSPELLLIKDTDSYKKLLEDKGKVVIDPAKRKKIILDVINNIEKNKWKNNFKVFLDEDLLNEVVNLVEIPNVLAGSFPEEFLYIPKDILIKAIQYHQKYFAVLDKNEEVSTKFIVIQNGTSDPNGEIIKGNERVLKARLRDAAFFYEEDKKHDFSFWFGKLRGVVFYSGLGSIYDKAVRLKKMCLHIAELLEKSNTLEKSAISCKLRRACKLCKCDLVTNMVVEFPELQGIVGKEYAKEKGEKPDVAEAIFEHYLPRFSGDILPDTTIGSILSIADKVDTICGMFLAENIPTGSEDPFALRRKASGVIFTALRKKYDLDIDSIVNFSINTYSDKLSLTGTDKEKIIIEIKNFIIARYRFLLEKKNKSLDILEAILGSGCTSIVSIDLRYKAIEDFINNNDVEKISMAMIRCRNIIKGKKYSKVNVKLLSEEYEKRLYSVIDKKRKSVRDNIDKGKYNNVLLDFADLGKNIDDFFDNVLVMDRDDKIRANRINLVKNAADLYMLLADFSKLVVGNNSKM